jgi:hypothetical protein
MIVRQCYARSSEDSTVMHPIASRALLGALMLVPLGVGAAHSAETPTICRTGAWTTDNDPAGLNVRAGPGAEHPVVATLPPPIETDGMEFFVEVEIAGSQAGWFRITKAVLSDDDTKDDVVFRGSGWVSGRYLGLSVEGRYLRDGPSPGATAIIDFFKGFETNEPESGPDYFTLERIHACNGMWVEVEGTYKDQKLRGWSNDVCSNQVTTCP